MHITPTILTSQPKILVGLKMTMSMAHDRTTDLWRLFIPRHIEIQKPVNNLLFNLKMYDEDYFTHFHPEKVFEKWAAIEVVDVTAVPEGMHRFDLAGGLYAVFDYKGSSADPSVFQFIFNSWLPASGYLLDHRPHFELLGEKYRNLDPDSEEEIWIPVRPGDKI